MSHEIDQFDGVVLHSKGAWHGLGTVVEEAPTPHKALTLAGLDWGVRQETLYVKSPNGEDYIAVPSHVANYRADENILLGVVSDGWRPVSNADMADFCSALLENGNVKCETAGSIRNGKRVWFLLKGEPFEIANGDVNFPYILVSNGHDGSCSFRVTPTTVRAVCSNTLHMVVPGTDTGQLASSAIVLRHTANVMQRVEDARHALKHYQSALEETKEVANMLSHRDVNQEDVQRFFLECYTHDFGAVADNPANKKEERARDRAKSAFNSFSKRFDDERSIAGASLWNCVNAYSGLVQHDKKARGKDDIDRVEKRVDSNLFGLNQTRTQDALRVAFTMAQ